MRVLRTPAILPKCVRNLPPNVSGLLIFVDIGQFDGEAAHIRVGLLDSSHGLWGRVGEKGKER